MNSSRDKSIQGAYRSLALGGRGERRACLSCDPGSEFRLVRVEEKEGRPKMIHGMKKKEKEKRMEYVYEFVLPRQSGLIVNTAVNPRH